MKAYNFSNSLLRFKNVLVVYTVVMLILELVYSGILLVSVTNLTHTLNNNRRQAMSDSSLQEVQGYVQKGDKWVVSIMDEEGELVDKEYSNLQFCNTLRLEADKPDAAYFSEQGKSIVQAVGASYYIDYLLSSSTIPCVLGYFVFLVVLILIRGRLEFGWIAGKAVLVGTALIGIFLIGIILSGFIVFS